jgi:vacuolar-type H+-ATPase subunit D/Vma8
MPVKFKYQKQQKQQKTEQRKRALSSETSDTSDDLELILDTVVGALSNEDTLNRFVSALLEVQQIKDKLLAHLLPSLQNQISDILKPLQNSNNNLNKSIIKQ